MTPPDPKINIQEEASGCGDCTTTSILLLLAVIWGSISFLAQSVNTPGGNFVLILAALIVILRLLHLSAPAEPNS